jgi:hypothetical protein
MKDALIRLLILTNIALLIVAAAPKKPQVLTVSEVDVVDAKGVIRARLGGDLPDAVIEGKTIKRGGNPAGLMLYDNSGQERGGYVTFPNGYIVLTMDSHKPAGQMVTLVASPTGGGAALMLNREKDAVELRVDDELGPSLHAKHGNNVVFHAPSGANINSTELCGDLKKMPREKALEFCRGRISEEACQACLDGQ